MRRRREEKEATRALVRFGSREALLPVQYRIEGYCRTREGAPRLASGPQSSPMQLGEARIGTKQFLTRELSRFQNHVLGI